jgi:DNA-binding response OmpR family regulator
MIAEEDYDKAPIDDVISKPFALSDVLLRANTILSRHAVDHRETMTV